MKNLILTTLFFIVLTSCSDNKNSNNSEKFTKNLSNSIKETNEVKPTKAIEQDGNIYLIFTDGTKKQITFNQTDHEPILLKNKKQIVFVRDENISSIKSKIIMLVTIDDMKESTLSSQKPYSDGLVGTNDILAVDYPKL